MVFRKTSIICVILSLCGGPLVAADSEDDSEKQAEEAFMRSSKDGTRFSLADFSLRAGVYDIGAHTTIRLDALGGLVGTTIDLEDDLDMDDHKKTSYLALAWRMSGRHFLELEYFNLNRRGVATLTGEIEFGDQVFDFGAEVKSFFDTQVTRISYAYLFKDTRKFAFAFSAGLHITDLNTGISEINSQFSEPAVAVAAVTAPLPVIGITGAWRMSQKWFMYGRVQIFRLKFDDFSGSLDHASVKIEYGAFKHLGIGAGYDLFDMGIDIDRDRWNGDVSFRFSGPILYLKGNF
jgi:hypothetical protein